jgi:hypothetical protein
MGTGGSGGCVRRGAKPYYLFIGERRRAGEWAFGSINGQVGRAGASTSVALLYSTVIAASLKFGKKKVYALRLQQPDFVYRKLYHQPSPLSSSSQFDWDWSPSPSPR